MANHVKPTQEELDEQIRKSQEELEKSLQENPDPDPEKDEEEEEDLETPEKEKKAKKKADPEKEEESEEESEEEEEEESDEQEEEEKGKKKAKPAPEKEEKDEEEEPEETKLKKKLSASARENQKIYAKNRVLNQAIDEANEIPEPTEEELKEEFDEWDEMSDTEKRLAKESVVSKKWRLRIASAREQSKKIEKWDEEVEKFVDDPETLIKNPELEGKEEEFKAFATEESNNSVPFKVLVSAFLHEQSKNKKPKQKGKMFETGTGGPNSKDTAKSNKISLAEANVLMKTDYNKYKKYLNEDRIDFTTV